MEADLLVGTGHRFYAAGARHQGMFTTANATTKMASARNAGGAEQSGQHEAGLLSLL
jgi:hypothetical protein